MPVMLILSSIMLNSMFHSLVIHFLTSLQIRTTTHPFLKTTSHAILKVSGIREGSYDMYICNNLCKGHL